MKYHGVNPVKFPLYLKEMEFRYNNRHHDLYDAEVKCISEYSLVAFIQ
jgi:transposase